MSKHIGTFLLVLLLTGCSMPQIIVLNDPLDAGQHNDLGASYEKRQDYDLAVREYERAAKLDENWALPLFNLGNVHARLEQWPEAITAYKNALEIDPEMGDAENNLAWVLVKNGEPAKGVSLAEQLVARESGNPYYWDTLATAYLAANRPEDADSAARQGLHLTPSSDLRETLQAKLLGNQDNARD